ncbi:hypothetical protein [Tahibacter amnicola]|uniref:Sel1 repeat family protein n=1 Tax=Tahibacter amnicola TaxID=2976241 RepID=A0ABY6BDA7_9GAMM|nr:hypothetical protein [Tahibacter amnicola]UXI68014.1 hypothetical protein N4264_25355 [Tahibacter amnicola]
MKRSLQATVGAVVLGIAGVIAYFHREGQAVAPPVSVPAAPSPPQPAPERRSVAVRPPAAARPVPSTPSAPRTEPRTDPASVADAAGRYDELAKAAMAGDQNAAWRLVDTLSICRQVPVDQADLDGYLNEIAVHRVANPTIPADAEQGIRDMYRTCAPLTPEQRSSLARWLEHLGKLGDPHAQVSFVLQGAPEGRGGGKYWADLKHYREVASRWLDASIASGRTDTLTIASALYRPDPANKLYAPDPVKAYAYLHAYVLAEGQRPGTRSYIDRMARDQETMTPEDIAAATKEGERIYQMCCAR